METPITRNVNFCKIHVVFNEKLLLASMDLAEVFLFLNFILFKCNKNQFNRVKNLQDAPSSIYGLEKTTRQADILSDGAASTAVIGLLGDLCLKDHDCFINNSMCLDNICGCLHGFRPTLGNISCESVTNSFSLFYSGIIKRQYSFSS